MTVFDLEENTTGTWFEVEGGGRVQLRILSADEMRAIRRASVETRVEYKRVEGKGERFEFEKVNEELQNELLWDKTIVDWQNFYDSKNNLIPCDKEMKTMLMSKSLKFARLIGECLKKLAEDNEARTEQAEKN